MHSVTRPTLKQVAKLAEVSPTTASLILNNKEGVKFSEKTIRRVHQAAERLGYSRQITLADPQSVFQKRTIAIFSAAITRDYYSHMVEAIERAAHSGGYETICFQTYYDEVRELSGISTLANSDIAGIIFTYVPINHQYLERMQGMPVVVVGEHNDFVRLDMIEINNRTAGAHIARHLLNLGHRRVVYVNTAPKWVGFPSYARQDGLKEVFRIEGAGAELIIAKIPSGIEDGKISSLDMSSIEHLRERSKKFSHRCLDQYPSATAIVGATDIASCGILDAMAERGLRAPEDYSVCGFDNIHGMDMVGLTTVEMNVYTIGVQAFEVLTKRIHDKATSMPQIIAKLEVSCELIARRTSGPPRTHRIGSSGF